MRTKRVSLMAMAFTLVLAFVSVTAANALTFANGNGTWWKTTKQLDTGYLFSPVTDDAVAKAMKFKMKRKAGYMYIPAGSYNAGTYSAVVLVDYDKGAGEWIASGYNMVVYGGTPNDFVAHTDGPLDPVPGVTQTMALTLRAKLTEKKKVPGEIKSGQVRTLGSSLIMEIVATATSPAVTFAGKTDFRAKWIPATKVPQLVVDEAMAYLPPVP